MRSRRSRRTWITLVAVAGLHGALFLLLARALAPGPGPPGREAAMVPVYLARLEPKRPPRVPDRPRSSPLRARVSPTPAPPELAAAPAAPAPLVLPAEIADEAAERARLAGALRASRVGCANLALLTERERVRCEDRLAAGAAAEKYIAAPLPKARRAYHDAIAKAKSHERASLPVIPGETPVPNPKTGGSSLAALQSANEKFRIPIFGCKVTFGGPGAGVWKPPVGVKLGPLPCYVTPPDGSLTIEAHIQNPDKVVKGKD